MNDTIHAVSERHRSLMNRKASAWTAMQEARAAADAEARDMTGEEIQRWEAAEADLLSITDQIAVEERSVAYDRDMRAGRLPAGLQAAADETGERESRYAGAFGRWIRRGYDVLDSEDRLALRDGHQDLGELRAQSAGTGTAGGYTVPQGFAGRVIEGLASANAVRRAVALSGGAPLVTSSGIRIPFPTNNDTSNAGELIGENTGVAEQDMTFGVVNMDAFIFSSKLVRCSIALLEDQDVDLESYLGSQLANRIGRIQNQYFTTGSGSSQPNGVITASTTVTAAGAAAIAYGDLVNLTDAVAEPYRANAAWMMKQSTLSAVRKLVDGSSRPLWEPSLQAAQPDMLMGKPIVINEDMAAIATTNKTVAYGDFSRYQIRDVRGVTLLRLSERYAENLQVGFIAFQRSDADLLDTAAIRVLVQA